MFSAGDKVIYGRMGACVVREIGKRNFDGVMREYYILSPVHGRDQSIYVPTDSESLTAKMKRVISGPEINALMSDIAAGEMEWPENDTVRREQFERILMQGDNTEIAGLIGCIWKHRARLTEQGKRLHQSDERMLREARDRLHGELALALDISEEDVPAYIEERVVALSEK